MSTVNQRVWWPVQSVAVGPFDASEEFNTLRGVQSFGLGVRLAQQFLKEVGNLSTYDAFEELPEVELTIEKVLDGFCPIYLACTDGAATADLAGRADRRCHLRASVHRDNQSKATANQIAELFCSGAYVSSVQYEFSVGGAQRETVGIVGNDAVWTTGSYVYTGYNSTHGVSSEVPAYSAGVARRQHFDMTNSRFPKDIPGINPSTGVNPEVTIGGNTQFEVSFESITASANLGRQMAMELGRKGEYNRFVSFPVVVTSTFNFRSKGNPLLTVRRTGTMANEDNTTNQTILLVSEEGLTVDLGTKNRLTGMNRTGGDAGQQGDVMLSFTYENHDDLTVTHPADVTVALRP